MKTGVQGIDLEELAGHKVRPLEARAALQPSQEQFENHLAKTLEVYRCAPVVRR